MNLLRREVIRTAFPAWPLVAFMILVGIFQFSIVAAQEKEAPSKDDTKDSSTIGPDKTKSDGSGEANEEAKEVEEITLNYLIVPSGGDVTTRSALESALVKHSAYLAKSVFEKGKYQAQVVGMEASAKSIKDLKPEWGIVSPAFFLKHQDLRMSPMLELQLNDDIDQRYAILVKSKNKAWTKKDLKGKAIATDLSAELDYLSKVVCEQELDITWKTYDMLDRPLMAMFDNEKGAPDGMLVSKAYLKQFQEDKELAAEFAVVWTSEALPAPIFVVFEEFLPKGRLIPILTKFKGLNRNDEGKKILNLLGAKKLIDINQARLTACKRLYALPSKKERAVKSTDKEKEQSPEKEPVG